MPNNLGSTITKFTTRLDKVIEQAPEGAAGDLDDKLDKAFGIKK